MHIFPNPVTYGVLTGGGLGGTADGRSYGIT